MRQIYASPRHENIDRVVALLAARDIETRVLNRSAWKRSGYQRFSYQYSPEQRENWGQVWVLKADDYAAARNLLRELAIEPSSRHSDELAQLRRGDTLPARARRIALVAVCAVFVLAMLHYLRGH